MLEGRNRASILGVLFNSQSLGTRNEPRLPLHAVYAILFRVLTAKRHLYTN